MRATRYTNIFTHIIISCLKAIVKANRLFQFSNNRLNRNHLYTPAPLSPKAIKRTRSAIFYYSLDI